MPSYRAGRRGAFSAELEFAGKQVLQAFVVHHQHHQVDAFGADLKTPASAADGNKCGRAPAGGGAAAGDAAAVLTAENEAGLDQVRDYHDAFRTVQHFFRNALVGRIHDLLEHVAGILQPLDGIFLGVGQSHAAQQSNQTDYCCKSSFHFLLLGNGFA